MRLLVVVSLVSVVAAVPLLARDSRADDRMALTPPTAAEARDVARPDVAPSGDAPANGAENDNTPPLTGDARDDFDDLPPRVGERTGPTDGLLSVLLKTMLMLALVVGLAYLTLHKGVGKLMARAQQGQRIKVLERVPLGERRSLYLVTVDGKEMLLGVGEGGITTLHTSAPRDAGRFATLLEAGAEGSGAESSRTGSPDSGSMGETDARHVASPVDVVTAREDGRRNDV
jgi:flagellar biosynthetic protein FliO